MWTLHKLTFNILTCIIEDSTCFLTKQFPQINKKI